VLRGPQAKHGRDTASLVIETPVKRWASRNEKGYQVSEESKKQVYAVGRTRQTKPHGHDRLHPGRRYVGGKSVAIVPLRDNMAAGVAADAPGGVHLGKTG
jgi:hypothetical protein